MRAVVLPILGLLLSACASGDASLTTAAAPPSAGDWKIERRIDRISGAPAATALLPTRASNTRALYSRAALLQLMCFDKEPIVRLAFDFRVGANKSAVVEYRFDDKPGRKPNATFLPDYRTIVIKEKADVARFLDELASSSNLFVRVSSLFSGRTTLELRVAGAPAAIDAAYSECPLSTDQPRRRTSALSAPMDRRESRRID